MLIKNKLNIAKIIPSTMTMNKKIRHDLISRIEHLHIIACTVIVNEP